ncbi:MAG: carboxypeptidase M32, partial [Actinomycetota bacterium]|nr:carboxypeptidase M32 [Actinomycetota bacterium]
MPAAFERLKLRLGDYAHLQKIMFLLFWDQRTMMPPAGAAARAEHIGTLARKSYEALVDDETGRLLDELRGYEESLDPDSFEASLIRVGRADYERARTVPPELRGEMSRAGAEGQAVWADARAHDDFSRFLPALERHVELRRRYIECFEPADEPYDLLLDEYERGMKTAQVRSVFERLKEEQIPLVAQAADREDPEADAVLGADFPIEGQSALGHEVVELFGFRPGSW